MLDHDHNNEPTTDFVSESANIETDLRRTFLFDGKRADASLRRRAFTRLRFGSIELQILAEPLLRSVSDGYWQPIRVHGAPLPRTMLFTVSGRTERVEGERVGDGVRFFVPEQSVVTDVLIAFPEFDAASVRLSLGPVRRWDLSLVHHSHFDLGYTDLQGRVILEQLAFIDDALTLAEADADNHGPAAFRWSIESAWVLREWIHRRSPDTVDRLMRMVRAERIEVAALPFNVHTEACSTEELHGLLRYSRDIAREHALELPVAYQTDVPGCVAGTVDALSDAGVRYLSLAHNWAGRSVPYLRDGVDLPRLFWWESPAGKRVLVWMTTTAQAMAYQEGAYLGLVDGIDRVEDMLSLFLHCEQTLPFPFGADMFGFALGDGDFARAPYPWDEMSLRVMGRVGDNSPPNRRLPEIVEEWNQRWAYPQLRITRTEDYMREMERLHGEELEVVRGDWNDWWADGIGSSARGLQLNRGAQARLPQAVTVQALSGQSPSSYFRDSVEDAWAAIELFDEHTWGAANPWTAGDVGMSSGIDQWHWKSEKALRADQETMLLEQEALREFADRRSQGTSPGVWVVNTSGYDRTGTVSAFIPESLVHTTTQIRVLDDAGVEVAFRERNQVNPVHRDAGRFVEFVAVDVPASGARWFALDTVREQGRTVTSSGLAFEPSAATPTWALDNGLVRVNVDPRSGSITSIWDLALGRELVNLASPFGFNVYVHDRYATRGEVNHQSSFTTDFASYLTLLSERTTARHASFEDAGKDALGSWLRYRTTGAGIESIETTIRIGAESTNVDVTNRICKPYTTHKEAGFFAFPFAVDTPTVRFEVSGGVAGTDLERVRGGADYMHCVRDWIAIAGTEGGGILVTQDAPLVQFADIALPFAPFPGTTRSAEPATVFSWVHNNVWDTNFPPGQTLDMDFRYRVQAAASLSPEALSVAAARAAESIVRPLLAVAGTNSSVPAGSLLRILDDRVRLLSVQRLQGNRFRALLQSLSATPLDVRVELADGLTGAIQVTPLGDAPRSLVEGVAISISFGGFAVTAIEFEDHR